MLSIFYRDDDGSPLDITAYVNLSDANFKTTTNAEQGSVGTNTFDIDDPTGVLNIVGHRRVWAMEDSAPIGMQLVFWGYTADRDVTRTTAPVEASRKWTATIVDINSLLQRKVMAGNDTDRPEETDVERIQWLMTTGEAGFFDDTTTFIDTSSPVPMDAADYNGQMFANILDDCAQQSGKNYYARFPYDGGISDYRAAVWYGKDANTEALSDLRISNVISDVTARVGDGDPGSGQDWVWEPAFDSQLNRDPSRVYSGVFGNYDGGYTYRTRSATITEFANRDTIASWPNVKTLAKAQARGDRYLLDLHTEEDVVSTTILVTPEHVNDAMAGDEIEARFSHMPEWESFRPCRILNRTVTFITPEVYQIDYDLTPLAPAVEGNLLVAFIAYTDAGMPEPEDHSDNEWTKAFWTGDIADAGQFPGPGHSVGVAMWYRAVVPGESASVLRIGGGGLSGCSAWVFQCGGWDGSAITETHDNGPVFNATGLPYDMDSPSAAVLSAWITGIMLQKVDYGQMTKMHAVAGTELINANSANATGAYGDNDLSPPWTLAGYAIGTGVLTYSIDKDAVTYWTGATPNYNLFGAGVGGLLVPLVDSFSIIQEGFNSAGGADVVVTLPSAP